jgi:hypothetical protein
VRTESSADQLGFLGERRVEERLAFAIPPLATIMRTSRCEVRGAAQPLADGPFGILTCGIQHISWR